MLFTYISQNPSSTYKMCPFKKSDADDTRKTTGLYRSCGVPQRPAGVFEIIKLLQNIHIVFSSRK